MQATNVSASSAGKPLIHGLLRGELENHCRAAGQPAFRSEQIWRWLYVSLAQDWDQMRNLPAALRQELDRTFNLHSARATETCGKTGATRKILTDLPDGEQIEQVLIPARGRRTVCISCQAGCRYACSFCASGRAGLRRNLESGEMVGQVVLAARLLGERPTHVVFMGIGEPFDNYEAVLKAVRILNDPAGLGIGARRITISTCGIVPGIRRLAAEGLQVELSISLHAPDDKLRSKLMPVNRIHPLRELLDACAAYTQATNRIVTFEYVLIDGFNSSARQADELGRLLAPLHARVNLIPLSPVSEFDGRCPSPASAQEFITILGRAGINTTLRASKGGSLDAACGQLRWREKESI